jgi:hypothetical protein
VVGEPETFRLADLLKGHGINAALFMPFVIERLQGPTRVQEVAIDVTIRDVDVPGERNRKLGLSWSEGDMAPLPPGVQDHIVTEWAALGIACAVVSVCAGLRVRSVTGQGDRFDYWVDDREGEFALEVTGTQAGELESRHRSKVAQFQENPFGVDGYVISVGFVSRRVIFSFHRFAEEVR